MQDELRVTSYELRREIDKRQTLISRIDAELAPRTKGAEGKKSAKKIKSDERIYKCTKINLDYVIIYDNVL